ncbi:Rdx family-domain-containing protein [Morchella snyderi]|nr:Rdx family-domain-containing protein [Morchella snyderi]
MESIKYPRVTIQFCTQCKWLLRAAYFAQELLSTFSTSLGEVSLLPATGGVFIVEIHHQTPASTTEDGSAIVKTILWDRKIDSGFPETKELKKRVRDVIDPSRDLGHVDGRKKPSTETTISPVVRGAGEQAGQAQKTNPACTPKDGGGSTCEDCNQ